MFEQAREIFEDQLTRVQNEVWGSLIGVIHCLLLPCCAAMNDWDAFDLHLKAASKAYQGSQESESDAATSAHEGATIAATAGKRDRARLGFDLAKMLWMRLGRDEAVEIVDRALLGLDT